MGPRNLRLGLDSAGTRSHGWQRQKNALTLQETIETAVAILTGERVHLIGSGRTDAGVHALRQVANFHTRSSLPLRAFVPGLNSLLPPDIAVLAAAEVPAGFHARKSARAKTYEYRLLNRPVRSPLSLRYAWQVAPPLEEAALAEAARLLVGEHDFAAFQASGSAVCTTRRRVEEACWQREGDMFLFRITATGFLRGMVRSLVGTMVQIGLKKRPVSDLAELLARPDRTRVGPTAPPQGLFLVSVRY